KPKIATTRRRLLRGLAAGLLAGAALALPLPSEAKITATAGRIGGIIAPSGDAAINSLPANPTFKYGGVFLSGTGNFNLSTTANLNPSNTAVYARSDNTGVVGAGGSLGTMG